MNAFGLVSLPSALPANHSREILSGIPGRDTAQTISRMRDMVTLGKREFNKRQILKQFVFDCSPKDYYCYAKKAFEFCRDKIRYVFDPNGVELIENPARILESRVADCDSIVILLATLCEQMGFPCRFVTIKADKRRPDDFTHVYLQIKVPGHGWVGADATQPNREFGWEPPVEYERKTWPASNDEYESHDSDEMAGFEMSGCTGCISGLGYGLPGTQETPGVIVEKPWEFRTEPAAITAHPEQLELNTLTKPGVPYTGGIEQSFMYASDAEDMFAHEPQAPVQIPVSAATPPLSGMGAASLFDNKMVWLAGAALLAFWLFSKKR